MGNRHSVYVPLVATTALENQNAMAVVLTMADHNVISTTVQVHCLMTTVTQENPYKTNDSNFSGDNNSYTSNDIITYHHANNTETTTVIVVVV